MVARSSRTLLAAALAFLLPGPAAAAPAPAERVAALGEEMLERTYDLTPALETFVEGTGPRAARARVEASSAMIGEGPLTLAMLRERVPAWIARTAR